MRWVILAVWTAVFCFGWVLPVNSQDSHGIANALILINVPSRTLEYYADDKLLKEYPIAVGKDATPTPLGKFLVLEKIADPFWYPPERPGYYVPPGPDNPLGHRWIGFSANYGIHGTNMPWSIGMVISNGCIRMQEEDVEELFELVTEKTPVQITYDRVKVRVDSKGQASIGIYPDVYGYENISLAGVKYELAAQGLGGLLDDNYLLHLIREEADQQIVFARVHSLIVNNKRLVERMISLDGEMYAPVLAVSACLKSSLYWDWQRELVIGKRQTVPGILRNGTVYVEAKQLQTLFGGRQVWNEEQNCLMLQVPNLVYEGLTVPGDIVSINGVQFVPALAVAKALGQRVSWDATEQSFWVGMRKVPARVIAGEPYVEIGKMSDYFNITINWDDEDQTVAMSYPRHAIDCSMYLEQMAPFVD